MLTILLVADNNYKEHLIVMVNSLLQNCKIEYRLYLHLINITSNYEVISKLVSKVNNLVIKYDQYEGIEEELKAYCANIRIQVIYKLLCDNHSDILYIDVDSIVRSDLERLYKQIINSDLSLFPIFAQYEPKIRFKAGIMGVHNSDLTKEFFENYMKEIDMLAWGDEQNVLTKLYQKYCSQMKIAYINDNYLDWHFRDYGIIWTAKGNRKNDPKFIAESHKYWVL
jgi:lipopolysaccharide biosynthesis glycosyltransferase